jgi:hypothetical protein
LAWLPCARLRRRRRGKLRGRPGKRRPGRCSAIGGEPTARRGPDAPAVSYDLTLVNAVIGLSKPRRSRTGFA